MTDRTSLLAEAQWAHACESRFLLMLGHTSMQMLEVPHPVLLCRARCSACAGHVMEA